VLHSSLLKSNEKMESRRCIVLDPLARLILDRLDTFWGARLHLQLQPSLEKQFGLPCPQTKRDCSLAQPARNLKRQPTL
jgi:hypothetical protein